MADAAGHHPDQDLSGTRHRHGYVLYHQWLAELVRYGSLHHLRHLLNSIVDEVRLSTCDVRALT